MTRLLWRRLVVGSLIVILAVVFAAMNIHAGETAKKIRIIYSNDTMGYLDPCG